MSEFTFDIQPVHHMHDLEAVRELFRAYAASLDIDLAYQDFEKELSGLPGSYAPPKGEILLPRGKNGNPVGCVALRPLGGEGICEIKRLYVTPEGRGHGLGRQLVNALVLTAESIGYHEMRLDTLATMAEAQALYHKSGFAPVPAYYDTPIADTVFMARHLRGNKAEEAS